MPRENRSKGKKQRIQKITNANAVKCLRTLGNEQAFYFYEAVGKPTGQCAKNLREFSQILESASPKTIAFHIERNDFKNWIANTLEDAKLAKQIEKVPSDKSVQARKKVCAIIKARLSELEGSATFLVIEPGKIVQ
jgi:SOS-response transcriptional repressor LexA